MPDVTCSIEGCEKDRRTRGWCATHYARWLRTGRLDLAPKVPSTRQCSIQECGRPHYGRGWCQMHYLRWQHNGDPNVVRPGGRPRSDRICSIEDCEKPHNGRGWCGMHLARWHQHGDPNVVAFDRLGDYVTAGAVHARLRRTRGPASDYACLCGAPAVDWSYDHACPNEKVEIMERPERGGSMAFPYSTDLDRYQPLCRTCHRRRDLAHSRTR